MESKELYQCLLGLDEPWTVERVELDMNRQQVDVYAEHPSGTPFECPQRWYYRATHSRLPAMVDAAKLIARHLQNILTYFKYRITNAVSEGLNSKIAIIQTRACGFRNRDHFKIAIYFHCGGLDLYPASTTHRKLG